MKREAQMNIFDILGPVMVGPSSSHTAGAVRIGLVTRRLLGEKVKTARIGMYGSFAATGKATEPTALWWRGCSAWSRTISGFLTASPRRSGKRWNSRSARSAFPAPIPTLRC